jgi:uncharacterized protein
VITIVDTGPLVALIDKGQRELHEECVEKQKELTAPLITTWLCIGEAMHLLYRLSGWKGQKQLWEIIEKGGVEIYSLGEDEARRMHVLMEQYQDTPMDLADASLVAVAEATGLRRVFTIDKDFFIYKIGGKDLFEVINPTV